MNTDLARDIAEIQKLLAAYAFAIDARAFDRLDDIFTPDAQIDYTATGGAAGDYPTIKTWLVQALAPFRQSQHLLGLPLIEIVGDRATARTMLFNPMLQSAGDHLFFVGASYLDDLVRTERGWRICRRRQADVWVHDPQRAQF